MYPPLDTPKPVADSLWIVDSGPLGRWMRLPIRMTVVRLKSGALWVHSPTRLASGLSSEINALGVVGAHGRWFDRDGSTRLRRSLSWLVHA